MHDKGAGMTTTKTVRRDDEVWKRARSVLNDVRPGVPAEQHLREVRAAMWRGRTTYVTMDMIQNAVIDDLIQRAGHAVMSDGTGEGTNYLVASWLREQKVP